MHLQQALSNGLSVVGRAGGVDRKPPPTLASFERRSERPQVPAQLPVEGRQPSPTPAAVRADDSDSSDDGGSESGDLGPGVPSSVASAGSVEPVSSKPFEPVVVQLPHGDGGSEPGSGRRGQGVQLPQADVVHETAPWLFDGLPTSELINECVKLDGWSHTGDRMLFGLGLPVSGAARQVAAILLWYGWASFPSRETLCERTGFNAPNVTRATRELEREGFLVRRTRTTSGRGLQGNFYVFCGMAVCRELIRQGHPTLGELGQAIIAHYEGRGVNMTPRSGSEEPEYGGRDVVLTPRGGSESPEVPPGGSEVVSGHYEGQGRGVNVTSRGGLEGSEGRGRGVILTPPEPEGEDGPVARSVNMTSPGVSIRHPNPDADLIDIHNPGSGYQSINGSDGSGVNMTRRPGWFQCAGCGVQDLPEAVDGDNLACVHCGVLVGGPGFGQIEGVVLPAWYLGMARRLDREKVPAYLGVMRKAVEASWSDLVLGRAADRYASSYSGTRVSAPDSLMLKVCVGVCSEISRKQGLEVAYRNR